MSKKIIISIVLLISLVLSVNFAFAADNLAQNAANMTHDAANTVTNSINKTENTIQNAGNEVMNATNNVVDGARNAINTMTEDRNNDTTPDGNNNNTATTANNSTNYTATRTAAEGTLLGMNATTWTWIIMGLVAISIIALVWYYSMQTTDKGYDD